MAEAAASRAPEARGGRGELREGAGARLSPAARLGVGGSDCHKLFIFPLNANEHGAGPGGSAACAASTTAVLSHHLQVARVSPKKARREGKR